MVGQIAPNLFCSQCQRYLGLAARCAACGWERPAGERLPPPGEPCWRFRTAGRPQGLPLAAGGRLYCGTREGLLYALDLATGQPLWQTDMGSAASTPLVTRSERLYAATQGGEVLALDAATGEILWRFPTQGPAGGLAGDRELLYLGDAEGTVYALDDDGNEVGVAWRHPVEQRIAAAPVPWGHLLLVVTQHHAGLLLALDIRSGEEYRERLPLEDRAAGPPLVVGPLAVVATERGQVRAFTLKEGRPAWSFAAGGNISAAPTTDGETVYLGTWAGRVAALEAGTGQLRWEFAAAGPVRTSLARHEGLLFAAGQDTIHALESTSGQEIGQFSLEGGATTGLVAAGGLVYAGDQGGSLVALPWHLGAWSWAAQHSAQIGEQEAAACFHALAGEGDEATVIWEQIGRAEAAAQMWRTLGQYKKAAKVLWQATEGMQATDPDRAITLLLQAADLLSQVGEEKEADRCRERVRRMSRPKVDADDLTGDYVRGLRAHYAPTATPSAASIRNRWALLVGADRYVDPAVPPLRFCVNDVIALGKLLQECGYTVVTLHDNAEPHLRPTRDNVEAELSRLCQVVEHDDLFWVHFACHGKLLPDGRAVLITTDTRLPTLEKRALPLADVERQMRASNARRLVLTLDACHTGVEMGRDIADPAFIRNAYELAEGFALIAASTAQQVAQEWQATGHGVFTYYLLEGLSHLADRADKGFVTVDDLKVHVLDGLRRWIIEHSGMIQEPTARTEGMGDIILADYREKT